MPAQQTRLRLAAVAALLCLLMPRAFAATAAVLPDPSSLGTAAALNVVVGWEFSPAFDIDVTALGLFDLHGDGLSDLHTLAIWTSSGDLLTQQLMGAGTDAPLIDGFRYIDIAPLRLIGDEKYVIGAFYLGNASDLVAVASFPDDFETHPIITALGGRVGDGTGFAFPGQETPDHLFGPNFRFTVVPLPAAAWLMLAALASLAGVSRRR